MKVAAYTADQAAAWVRLMNLVRPVPISVPEFEAREAAWAGSEFRLRYLGHDGSGAIALAQLAVSPYAPVDHLAAIVVVDPEHVGQGYGTTMLAVLEGEARARDFRGLVGTVQEDARRARAWMERRGFHPFAVRFDSLLNLERFDRDAHARHLERASAAGVTFADMSGATGAQWRELLSLFQSLLGETPDMQDLPVWTTDRCRAVLQNNPNARPEWIIVARHASKAIGLTIGHKLGDEIYAYFTGVAHAWRGQNIGVALKLMLIEAARSHGVETMRATNLDRNTPILRVNAALGFKKALGTIEYRKLLAPAQA